MGLPRDLRAFGELIQRAAADGSSDALYALGGAFFHGEDGFARDPRAAFRCAGRQGSCVVFRVSRFLRCGLNIRSMPGNRTTQPGAESCRLTREACVLSSHVSCDPSRVRLTAVVFL